mmetsp:Transcript_15916/g.32283  ORF Transcript_15916/g.32283 Transcript_15916/m.32283 type:complete len:364 (-) Transcript_15916:1739-2830(-)
MTALPSSQGEVSSEDPTILLPSFLEVCSDPITPLPLSPVDFSETILAPSPLSLVVCSVATSPFPSFPEVSSDPPTTLPPSFLPEVSSEAFPECTPSPPTASSEMKRTDPAPRCSSLRAPSEDSVERKSTNSFPSVCSETPLLIPLCLSASSEASEIREKSSSSPSDSSSPLSGTPLWVCSELTAPTDPSSLSLSSETRALPELPPSFPPESSESPTAFLKSSSPSDSSEMPPLTDPISLQGSSDLLWTLLLPISPISLWASSERPSRPLRSFRWESSEQRETFLGPLCRWDSSEATRPETSLPSCPPVCSERRLLRHSSGPSSPAGAFSETRLQGPCLDPSSFPSSPAQASSGPRLPPPVRLS